jgi:transposase InsO family protein
MVPVRQLCAILALSRSWYYAAQGAADEERDVALRAEIEQIVLEFPGYGYRRVTKALQRAGWTVNHKRVLRIRREEALLCQLKRRWVPTTDSGHGLTTYPNLLLQTEVSRLNQIWVADITYIRLPRGFAYLAAILEAFSRRVIGWALARWIDTALTLQALDHALATRPVEPGLIHHSDRGVQYASSAYVERLHERGIQVSMAARGHPYENAQAESFFKTLKSEEVDLKEYCDIDEAQQHLDRFIDAVYNTTRLHSALGYRPPAEFELLLSRRPCELALVR